MEKDKMFQMASKITEDGLFETKTAEEFTLKQIEKNAATELSRDECENVNNTKVKFLLINYYEKKISLSFEISEFLGVDKKDIIEIFREVGTEGENIKLFSYHDNGFYQQII